MKSATELLAEMLALHADPQKGAAELYLWLHHRKGEVKEAVERGEDIEPDPCPCVDADCPLFHRNSYTNPSQEQLKGWMEDSARLDWIDRNMDCDLSGHGLHVRLVDQEDDQTLRDAIDDAISLWGPIDRARGEGE